VSNEGSDVSNMAIRKVCYLDASFGHKFVIIHFVCLSEYTVMFSSKPKIIDFCA
jgi:hypothetical protein